MRIILIGFMGSGKSTTGDLLAKKMNLSFVDLDSEIVATCNMSIQTIFSQKGEVFFREQEQLVAQQYAGVEDIVIATGGGAPFFLPTLKSLKDVTPSIFVWLYLSFEKTVVRIRDNSMRPLMNNQDKAEKLFIARCPLYDSIADIKIPVGEMNVEQVTKEIMTALEQLGEP